MQRRLQLEGQSLDDVTARVFAEHGSAARIVAAEKVTVGGIRGFLARQYYEVTVEIGDRPRRAVHAGLMDVSTRVGIAALLDEADAAEAQLRGDAPSPAVSTGTDDFARLMDDLTFTTASAVDVAVEAAGSAAGLAGLPGRAVQDAAALGSAAAAAASVAPPSPLRRAGDLVLVVGAEQDAFVVARSLAAAANAPAVYVGGSLVGTNRVEDRRTALAARAAGVAAGHSVFVAFGLGPGARDAAERAASVAGIAADQIWLAVDAGRKPDDTARWVQAVTAAAAVDAVAVQGSDATSSPDTVASLGLPIGWRDGRPAA
ncbi:hypothetical protein [Salinibacterium sp. ZJ454]|uniref:hypothetical protein n=1 Tax=Salinibacterium sp. ZJ454 TaxID=2708339 RepID=UPI0014242669|nr:hypothetical protein [Salinibacterium sp. ZJ454]